MNNKDLPLSVRREKKHYKKLLITLLFIVIFTLTSILLPANAYSVSNIEYKVLAVQKTSPVEKIVSAQLGELQEQGYTIIDYKIDIPHLERIFANVYAPDYDITKDLVKAVEVTVSTVELKIDGDDTAYYFKSETECQDFIDSLNKIKKQTYSINKTNQHYSTITSTNTLKEKVAQVRTEKEKEERAKARERQVTTVRSSSTPRTSSYNIPLASYHYISSYYGQRNGRRHTGIDIAANAGTNIFAWKDGVITQAGWYGGYGNFIVVSHNDGTVSRYGHCSKIAVTVGQTVSKGEVIGYVGTTGNSTGNHLHFEILVNGNFVNPLDYMSI